MQTEAPLELGLDESAHAGRGCGLRIDSARHDSSKVYARYFCRKI